MALKAISSSQTWDYVSKSDPGHPDNIEKARELGELKEGDTVPEPTVWELGSVPSRVMSHIEDETAEVRDLSGAATATIKQNHTARELVRAGLRGWRNFQDDDGNEVSVPSRKRRNIGGVDVACLPDTEGLDLIPLPVIRELADELRKGNVVSEADRKN